MLNRKRYHASNLEMEFHMINIIYAALSIRAQTEKTTFSCKDDCTLMKTTRGWKYYARDFEILLCLIPPLRSFFYLHFNSLLLTSMKIRFFQHVLSLLVFGRYILVIKWNKHPPHFQCWLNLVSWQSRKIISKPIVSRYTSRGIVLFNWGW